MVGELYHGALGRSLTAILGEHNIVSPITPRMDTGDLDMAEGDLDRKSTRLNSSHKPTSYAVFCLKKKKNNNSVGDVTT